MKCYLCFCFDVFNNDACFCIWFQCIPYKVLLDELNITNLRALEVCNFYVKGTPLRSGCVTHLKRIFWKTCFLMLLTCVGHSSLSCGTLIYLLSVGNSFKTCIIYVDLGKTLVKLFPVSQVHSNFKLSCQINREHNY